MGKTEELAERRRLKVRAKTIAQIRETLRSDYGNSFEYSDDGPVFAYPCPADGSPTTARVMRLQEKTCRKINVVLKDDDVNVRVANIWDLPDEALKVIRDSLPGPKGEYEGVAVMLDPKVFELFKYRAANVAHKAPSALLREFMVKFLYE